MSDGDVQRRMDELEARVASLEANHVGPSRPRPRPLDRSEAADEAGQVSYRGEVRLHGDVRWTITLAARAILDLPDPSAARVLAALAHPTRAAIARRLLAGPASVAELQQATGVTSAGRLYHHLNALTACRAVEAAGGSRYRVPAPAVVPTMVLLLAAADLGGDLDTVGTPSGQDPG